MCKTKPSGLNFGISSIKPGKEEFLLADLKRAGAILFLAGPGQNYSPTMPKWGKSHRSADIGNVMNRRI
jgi:hypothetical protein